MTAPIAPGESSIAPSTDSSASRFCGGTCGDCADGGTAATWDMAPIKPQRRTASRLGIHRRLWEAAAAICRQKERAFAAFSTASEWPVPARPQQPACPLRAGSSQRAPQACGARCGEPTARSVSSGSVAAPRLLRRDLGLRLRLGLGLRRVVLLGRCLGRCLRRAASGSSSSSTSSAASASARCASASACAAACTSASAASIAASSSSGGSSPPSGTTRVFTSTVTFSNSWIGTE